MNENKIEFDVSVTGIEESLKLAQELEGTLEKANSLADELASKKLTIEIDI